MADHTGTDVQVVVYVKSTKALQREVDLRGSLAKRTHF
jgi:hypothetical protein